MLPFKVNKATIPVLNVTVPSGLSAIAGQELKSVALPTGYTWENSETTIPKKLGTYSYPAMYCNDVSNYEQTTGISIPVTATCIAHEFGDWSGSHADCTHDGKLTRSCSICGETETIKEPALGHDYKSEITTEPTATKEGIRTFTCSRCGDTYTETIPATGTKHEHSYTSKVTIEPTCLEAGEKTYTCSCGDTYTETIEPLGHDMVNGVCSRCGFSIPPVPEHTHIYTESGTTATCIEAGITTYTCSCGDFHTEKTPAFGHNMVNGVCTRCGYKQSQATPIATPTAVPTTKPTATPTATTTTKPTTAPTVTQETSTQKSVAPVIIPVITSNVETTDKPKTQSSTVKNTGIKNTPTQVAAEESLDVVRINLQNSTVLTADKIGKLKDDEKEIQLMMPDDILWDIDVSSIQKEDELNVDMAVELGDADIPQNIIDSIIEDEPYVLMSLAHDGPFNFDATLSIPVEKQYQGMIANLFYFNEDLERMEFIASARPDENGYASFNMKHASEYAIVFAESSLETITNDTQTTTEPDTTAQEVFNEQNLDTESIENIILIVSVVVLIIVFLFTTGLIIKFRKKKHDDYYLDEEDDEVK